MFCSRFGVRGSALAAVAAVWLAAACQSAPPAWEAANPIKPLPAGPLGTEIDLASLKEPPTPERVRLGRWLFFDTRLSGDNTVSCATCHDPALGFTDGRARARGEGDTPRHAPSIAGAAGALSVPAVSIGDAEIYYEVHGAGFPVLLYAPGGLKSELKMWGGSSPAYPNGFPWMDPREALSDRYTVIAMDQRNAGGQSNAPIRDTDGWHTFASDHIALLDHLNIDRCHLYGQCIGGPFILSLLKLQPERFACAILAQPIGRTDAVVGERLPAPQLAEPVSGRRLAAGESIAVNGCCLTVVGMDASRGTLSFQAGPETLSRTNLGGLRSGSRVNPTRRIRSR